MPTPDFILELRELIGTRPLPLVGVTAVVVRGDEVLLGRRADTGALTPINGIVDPGEEPADAAVREVWEEAGVRATARRLVWVRQVPRVTYVNGDQCDYLDVVFRCDWLAGEPYPVDGEMSTVGWFRTDALGDVDATMRAAITAALSDDAATRFEGGDASLGRR